MPRHRPLPRHRCLLPRCSLLLPLDNRSVIVGNSAATLLFWLLLLFSLAEFSRSLRTSQDRTTWNRQDDDGGRGEHRKGKFLSIFNVIRFNNDPCSVSGSKNGTCFTEQECQSRGGVNGGMCAQGFGVCCIITINCGESSSDNCTYFDSDVAVAGGCQATVCPCNNNICQLRLDFDLFEITGPSTVADVVTSRPENTGVVGPGGTTVPLSARTQCLTDTFGVSNGDGPTPSTICGINTGEHMYVDSNQGCNTLTFQLGSTGMGAMIVNRMWSIKVTQYSCNFPNLAPQGCTQYFFDSQQGNFQTFNYANGAGLHLASQSQQVCFRRERQYCRICYTAVDPANDFDLSGTTVVISGINSGSLCCSYGNAASSAFVGFDCLHIPNAVNSASSGAPLQSNICGNTGLKTSAGNGPICSTRAPFSVLFRSDAFEVGPEAIGGNRGFTLQYVMDATGCDPTATG